MYTEEAELSTESLGLSTRQTIGNVCMSPRIDKLAVALAKAQAEITGAKKDSTNPHFKSHYADLASVWDACRPQLTKHGLSVIQLPITVQDQVGISNLLLHESGQFIQSEMLIKPSQPQNPQAVGSILTYFRRYALSGTAGVPQVDDDGNAGAAPAVQSQADYAKAEMGESDTVSITGTIEDIKADDNVVWLKVVEPSGSVKTLYKRKAGISPKFLEKETDSDAYKIQGEVWEFAVGLEEKKGDKTVQRIVLASPVSNKSRGRK